MSSALRNRRALVTGSTGGIGLAIARRLAADGCAILLHGLAGEAEGDAAAREINQETGSDARYLRADLSRPDEIADLLAAAGTVDILVNNAASVRHFAPVDAMPPEHWDLDIAVNLSAAFHAIRLALPGMRARGWGRIVNMSSIYGLIGAADRVGYVVTKTGLIGMTRAVALETVRQGITCNALCPGTTLTPGIEERIGGLVAGGLDHGEATEAVLKGKQPTGRFVEAGPVADLVAFLCGPSGRDITGAAFPVDGGWSAG